MAPRSEVPGMPRTTRVPATLLVTLATAAVLRSCSAHAEDPPTPPARAIQVHGFVDAYADWNPNQPSDRDNFEPGTGTTARNANQFGLNLAALDISLDANPVGFHVVGVAGTGTDVVHAGELHPDRMRSIYQASVSYKVDVGRGVLLEVGIQPSHIGNEVFFSKDNWNYTRGWMGEFSPYYQTGLKVATSLDDHWSGQLWLLNGWQNIEDNNGGKSIGTQIAYAKDALGVTLNTSLRTRAARRQRALALVRRFRRDAEDLFECAAGRDARSRRADETAGRRPLDGKAHRSGSEPSKLFLFSPLFFRPRIARRVVPRPRRRRLSPFADALGLDSHVRSASSPAADPEARRPLRPLDCRRLRRPGRAAHEAGRVPPRPRRRRDVLKGIAMLDALFLLLTVLLLALSLWYVKRCENL